VRAGTVEAGRVVVVTRVVGATDARTATAALVGIDARTVRAPDSEGALDAETTIVSAVAAENAATTTSRRRKLRT
jgi:hypothetical protein